MSGFQGGNDDKYNQRINELNSRLKKIKTGNTEGSPSSTNYENLLSRFSELKVGSQKTPDILDLKERLDVLHPENYSNGGGDNATTSRLDDSPDVDSYIRTLEKEPAREDLGEVDDDFEAFIKEELVAREVPGLNMSAMDEMVTLLDESEVGIATFENSQSDFACHAPNRHTLPSRDKTDVDILMEQMDDEVRLLPHPRSALPGASSSAVGRGWRGHDSDEKELLKQLLMSARDEEQLDKKYGTGGASKTRECVNETRGMTLAADDTSSERSYGSNISDDSCDDDSMSSL